VDPLSPPERVVLIVEDHPDSRKSLAMLLEACGYPTAEAADGRQALDYLHCHPPPSLILLDLAMPVMDGLEFRRLQRQDPDLAAVPTVVCSVYNVDEEGALEGVAGFHVKPVDPAELLETVRLYCVPAA
jgi:CheY-like chemotaxis protein